MLPLAFFSLSFVQFGNTALHEAAKNNHIEIVALLLQRKANINILNMVINVPVGQIF